MRRALAHLLCCAALATLAGCGQLPKPFQPDGRENVIATLTRQATIQVLPTRPGDEATPAPREAAMAEAVAMALSDQGLLTTTAAPEGPTRRLTSVVRALEMGELHDLLAIQWTLYEYEGTVLGQSTQEARVLRAGWSEGSATLYQEIATAAAPRIAGFLAREAPEQSRIPGRPGANLVVREVTGAPGAGDAALTRAMIRELKLAELPVVAQAGEKDLQVAGSIAIERQENGADLVTVVWRVLGPDGAEIGVVEQVNQVAGGSLEGNWPRSASAIAGAAAPGVIALLNEAAVDGS